MAQTDDLETGNAPEEGGWTFDDAVTASFGDMLQRSIPNYGEMRSFVTQGALHALKQWETPRTVVDLGASRGDALAPIVDAVGTRHRYFAAEVSDPMLLALRETFRAAPGLVTVAKHDLRGGFPPVKGRVGVVLCVLTLMFVPPEHRQRLLRQACERLEPGGMLVLVEKVLPAGYELEALMNEVYWSRKQEQGYTREAVDRKRLSLEGVLMPMTAKANEELVLNAGFAACDVAWAWGPFRGWVAVRR